MGYTVKQICEHIAKAEILHGNPTPIQIWNYSPTGELFMLSEWFQMACEKIGNP